MKKPYRMKRLLALVAVLLVLLSACTSFSQNAAVNTAEEAAQTFEAELQGKKRTATPTATPKKNTKRSKATATPTATPTPTETPVPVTEDGLYTTMEDVALYIYLYGHLPANFITKDEAQDLGWPGGSLEPYAPGCSIGGDRFGNREGLLPRAKGRTYTECDIDTMGARSRGAKRIVFSNDGLIYYTEDHYASFILLYGEE